MDANRLTIVLAAIAGIEIDLPLIDRMLRREIELKAIVARLDQEGLKDYRHRLGTAGSSTGDLSVFSFQRLRQAHARQAEQIASLEEKVKVANLLLASRERALGRIEMRSRSRIPSVSVSAGS